MSDAFTAMIGAGTGGVLGTLGNIWAQQRQWKRDEYMLEEGPSMYLAGMEKAGLNPLLMSSGGGMPPSALNPSQSTPKVSDPMSAAMMGIQAAKTIAETQRVKAETDHITSQTGGQDISNKAAQAVHDAAKQKWETTIDGKKYWLTGYNAKNYITTMNAWISDMTKQQKDIHTQYTQAAATYVKEVDPNANPEIVRIRAMYIALEMLQKEKKWQTTKIIGGMIGGASGGMGAAAIRGMMGGYGK